VAEDGEPTVMLVYTEADSSPNLVQTHTVAEQQWPVIISSAPKQRIELVEEDVYAVLGEAGEGDPKRLIFDTRASNHMTGVKEVFMDLDTAVVGIVQFGDGSVMRVKGCGTILFTCKNGEHQALFKAYYIPSLTTNIISCDQLDESGFQIHIEGSFMIIHDEQMRLLTKVHRSAGSLYALDIIIAWLVCMVACTLHPHHLRSAA
jgi:hypothetical protein